MNYKKLYILPLLAILAMFSACDDSKSYAELLSDESHCVNNYLVDQRVIGYEERDSTFKFETGADAPYYQLDAEGNLYMRVINPGTPGNRAEIDQLVYYRFMRYNLQAYLYGIETDGEGNGENLANASTSFRYGNEQASSYARWGSGIQTPLDYLPLDCEVELVMKSQLGPSSEIGNVIPYLYKIRYFKSQI